MNATVPPRTTAPTGPAAVPPRLDAGMAGGHMITVTFAATGHMVVDGLAP